MEKCMVCAFKSIETEAIYSNGKEYLCEPCLAGAKEYYAGFKEMV